ncbi:hypothetical protein IAR55_004912 [Kwoniella newhampshirensis]|uniref:EamA domain-containing protein n=1 Tax=Kwoniella newhampshirensis TaxID=1651941 RepID=A0AAW0YWV3_9TREE
MSTRPTIPSTPSHSLSKKSFVLPLAILIGIVISSAAQTEFAHYLVVDLNYSKTYFTFYFTHSTFALIFPIHLVLLRFTSTIPISAYLHSIQRLVSEQLDLLPVVRDDSGISTSYSDATATVMASWRSILPIWSRKVIWLTGLVSIPALAWFVAMSLSTPMDITAIYATSSFAAYGFSLLFLRLPVSKVTIGSVLLAFLGVVVISLDGVQDSGKEMGRRALGDGIMLFGAIMLGLYEVVYKLALPSDHGGVTTPSPSHSYSPLPAHHSPPTSPSASATFHHRPIPHSHPSPPIPLEPSSHSQPPDVLSPPSLQRNTSSSFLIQPKQTQINLSHGYPVTLPPALHANFLTSCIGLATLLLMWPPIVGLHWMGYETFQWPGNGSDSPGMVWAALEVVAWGGSLYNAGLMVLIGIWGPTTSSVANLLTIGLVAIVDALWTGDMPDLQTFFGVGMICVGFGVLLWEGEG